MACSSSTTRTRVFSVMIHLRVRGQPEDDRGPARKAPLRPDGAAVGFDQSFANGKSEADAAGLACAAGAVELIENGGQVALRNTIARVFHAEFEDAVAGSGADLYRRFRPRVFHRVVKKIDQHLHDEHEIHAYERQIGIDPDLDLAIAAAATELLDGGADEVLHIAGIGAHLNSARLDTAEIQKIAEQ